MPDDLKAFLKAGDPPVFMTFGSTATLDPSLGETTRLMIEAVSLGKVPGYHPVQMGGSYRDSWELQYLPDRLCATPAYFPALRGSRTPWRRGDNAIRYTLRLSIGGRRARTRSETLGGFAQSCGLGAQASTPPIPHPGKACQGGPQGPRFNGDGNESKSSRQGIAGGERRQESRRTDRGAVCE